MPHQPYSAESDDGPAVENDDGGFRMDRPASQTDMVVCAEDNRSVLATSNFKGCYSEDLVIGCNPGSHPDHVAQVDMAIDSIQKGRKGYESRRQSTTNDTHESLESARLGPA